MNVALSLRSFVNHLALTQVTLRRASKVDAECSSHQAKPYILPRRAPCPRLNGTATPMMQAVMIPTPLPRDRTTIRTRRATRTPTPRCKQTSSTCRSTTRTHSSTIYWTRTMTRITTTMTGSTLAVRDGANSRARTVGYPTSRVWRSA